jgi:hypothetical protein
MKKGWIDRHENIKQPCDGIESLTPHSQQNSPTPLVVNIITETIPTPKPLKVKIKKSSHLQLQNDNTSHKKIPPKVPPKPDYLKCQKSIPLEISNGNKNSEIDIDNLNEIKRQDSHTIKQTEMIEDLLQKNGTLPEEYEIMDMSAKQDTSYETEESDYEDDWTEFDNAIYGQV